MSPLHPYLPPSKEQVKILKFAAPYAEKRDSYRARRRKIVAEIVAECPGAARHFELVSHAILAVGKNSAGRERAFWVEAAEDFAPGQYREAPGEMPARVVGEGRG